MRAFNRRQVLTSGAASLTLSTLGVPDAEGEQTNVESFVVRSGEGRRGGPWLVHGERAFATKVSGADVGNTYAAIEVHTPPGYGPALHIHLRQNELFFMLTGSIGLQCGSDRTILNAGDSFMAPANVPHAYVTLGTDPARMLMIFDPAGDMEGFFGEYAPLVNVDGEPDPRRLAEVYAKHGMKVVGPPLKVSNFAFKKS